MGKKELVGDFLSVEGLMKGASTWFFTSRLLLRVKPRGGGVNCDTGDLITPHFNLIAPFYHYPAPQNSDRTRSYILKNCRLFEELRCSITKL